ncbi:hypothetical protein D3C71_317970 [compost metagenome]
MDKVWALLQDGVVVELTDIDPAGRFHSDFQWVPAVTAVRVGDLYSAGEFSHPESPLPALKTVFTVREFVRRFTVEEQLSVRQAQLTDMEVGLVYDDFNRAEFIDLADPAVAAGVDLYISRGLLAPGRREVLLAPEEVQVPD